VQLLQSKNELNGFEKASRKMLMTRGEVPKERIDKGEVLKTTFSKVLVNVQQLADLLDENVPELPVPSKHFSPLEIQFPAKSSESPFLLIKSVFPPDNF
jgi:hypothetical protein